MPGCVLAAGRNHTNRIGSDVTNVVEPKQRTANRDELIRNPERVLKHVAISPRCPITLVANTIGRGTVNTPENTKPNVENLNEGEVIQLTPANPKQFVFPRCLDCGGEFTEEHYRTCPAVKDAEDAEDVFLLMVGSVAILLFLSVVSVSFLITIYALNTK